MKKQSKGIVQLAKNRFEIRVRATCPRTGRRKEVRREAECTLTEARALQGAWRKDLEASLKVAAPRRQRLRDFVPSWLAGRRDDLKPSSAMKIAIVYDLHIAPAMIADLWIDEITSDDIERWIEDLRSKRYAPGKGSVAKRKAPKVLSYSPTTIRGYYRVLRTIITAASAKAKLPNPCEGVKRLKAKRAGKNFLRADELLKVLAFVRTDSPEWYPAILLDAFTALRWGELSALRWSDIDEAEGIIRVERGNWRAQVINSTKTGDDEDPEAKVVPLLPVVAEVLRDHRRAMIAAQHPGLRAGWIFPTKMGTLHKGSPLRKVLDRACEAAEVRRITTHGLRHTANDLLRRVADPEVVRAITGHATEQMTHHYSHIDEGEKRAAAERAFGVVTGGKGVVAGVPEVVAIDDPTTAETRKPRGSAGLN